MLVGVVLALGFHSLVSRQLEMQEVLWNSYSACGAGWGLGVSGEVYRNCITLELFASEFFDTALASFHVLPIALESCTK